MTKEINKQNEVTVELAPGVSITSTKEKLFEYASKLSRAAAKGEKNV